MHGGVEIEKCRVRYGLPALAGPAEQDARLPKLVPNSPISGADCIEPVPARLGRQPRGMLVGSLVQYVRNQAADLA